MCDSEQRDQGVVMTKCAFVSFKVETPSALDEYLSDCSAFSPRPAFSSACVEKRQTGIKVAVYRDSKPWEHLSLVLRPEWCGFLVDPDFQDNTQAMASRVCQPFRPSILLIFVGPILRFLLSSR